ncbi:hypothetical protein GOP47_0002020 [Adiantum capillus-veneris]|uniref:NADP-dependent oxidoreductase domain-containing protein n=1 Tax=Adiantum capillus-veneris TaxID=13818 RepID=A0A9D4V9X2_ADICA|nr:hypothetical protein GOP47_0002020 [Adiantum capillus-veneris]
MDVSRLCLGTMTFGEQLNFEEASRQLNMAIEKGINFIDSAEMYPVPQNARSQGKSEQYVGRWLKQKEFTRDKVYLATKVSGPSGQMTWIRGGPVCLNGKNIMDAVDGSLKRLQTDYIDLYQIHWPDRYVPMFGEVEYDPSCKYSSVPLEEQMEALSCAVSSGKVRHVGLSNETPYGVMEFCRLSTTFPEYAQIISIQNAYNLLCRTFDEGLAECCSEMRVSLLAYSPLAMGLLSGKYCGKDGGPSNARLNLYRGQYAEAECRYNLTKPNVMPAVKAYVEIAHRHNISPVALAIGFVLRHPLVKSAVIGATSTAQLQEILDASEIKITPQMMHDINQVHKRYPNPCP